MTRLYVSANAKMVIGARIIIDMCWRSPLVVVSRAMFASHLPPGHVG